MAKEEKAVTSVAKRGRKLGQSVQPLAFGAMVARVSKTETGVSVVYLGKIVAKTQTSEGKGIQLDSGETLTDLAGLCTSKGGILKAVAGLL